MDKKLKIPEIDGGSTYEASKVKADSTLKKTWKNPDLTESRLSAASAKSAKEEERKLKKQGKTVVDFNKKGEKKNLPVFKICLIVLIAFLVGLSIFGIWNRWFRYDDKQDLISQWRVDDSNATITIDKNKIYLGPNATYDYEVDTFSKMIFFTIGNMKGKCHYRFSDDRCQLAFVDNAGDNFFTTAVNDFMYFWDSSTCRMNGIELSPAYTKKGDTNTENTGIDNIVDGGHEGSVLLEKVSTKKVNE